ncbi:unnamed protein product [Thlaspi arvense]|uniref:Disease resistance R13L4/SHOC-2-like LRR domain-containing protein n=1 Tax=Thlaspi arvense TaxID=13288 RepID=A0AAU9S4G8_THLAR|nr:unnamed protein product [Thlaspi arvense]
MSESLMRLHFLLLVLLCCVSLSTFATENAHGGGLVGCRPRQIQAFTQFKNEFDTRGCNHSDFSNGVWCDKSTGEITKLRLSACLSGTLKPNSSLFGMHHLRYLNLSGNNFISSSLPFEFGNLNKLKVLSLSFNGFVGQVPSSFSNLSMLSVLSLSNNELSGSFPPVRNLTKFTVLRLSRNHFSGTLNSKNSLFELHELIELNLAFNSFSSSLLFEFGNLKKLESLSLSSNGFFGPVPPTISNMTSLTALYLGQNSFTGRFPLVQNLTKLSQLYIFDNHFYGTIPSSLFTLPFLKVLYLDVNQFSGSIEHPNSSSSSRLERLKLGYNEFERKILEPISKFITLKVLELSFPKKSYLIDLSLLSSLNFLVYLDVSGNNISRASLRPDYAIPLNLEFFFLSYCGISEFPKILKALKKLEFINISSNKIKGKIPEWFWNFPRLSVMDISNNSFNGFEGSVELLGNSSLQEIEENIRNSTLDF